MKSGIESDKGKTHPGMWHFALSIKKEMALSEKKWIDAAIHRERLENSQFTNELLSIMIITDV